MAEDVVISRLRRRRKDFQLVSVEHALVEHTACESKPDETTEREEERARLQHAIQSLPRDTRRIINAVYFEGLRQKEVARRMGCCVKTVQRKLADGIQHMKHELA